MKELSIEEKAKRYDEALEKAKEWYSDAQIGIGFKANLEKLFSELKEDEDERIKRFIINELACLRAIDSKGSDRYEELTNAIAWLEKQDRQEINDDEDILHRFSFYSYKDEPNVLYLSGLYVNEEYRNKGIGTKILEVADEVAKSLDCHAIRLKTKKDSNAERLYQTHGYNSLATEGKDENWLEKQGKNNMGISESTKQKLEDNLNNALEKETPESCNEFLEKQGEQKPADKVEPKFEIEKGKWYVCIQTYTLKGITIAIKGQTYQSNQDGVIEVENGDLFIDKIGILTLNYFKPWTIEDAKDGDVLSYVTDEEDLWIMIYQSLYEPYDGHVHYHALLFNDNFVDKGTCCICIDNLKPATKEQCDLLFQKMHEEGYELEADKKELKKIEQKSVEWNNSRYENIKDILKEILRSEKCPYPTLKDDLDWYLSIRPQEKKEWSEYDRIQLDEAIGMVEANGGWVRSDDAVKKVSDWLKGLRDRGIPLPSQEWSEEDKVKLNDIINIIDDSGYVESIRKHYITWLRNLDGKYPLPKSVWNPVDKKTYIPNGDPAIAQQKEFDKADPFNGCVLVADHTLNPDAYKRYVKIKDIAGYLNWKPSEKQLKTLEKWLSDTRHDGDSRYVWPIFENLYKDLKKLAE